MCPQLSTAAKACSTPTNGLPVTPTTTSTAGCSIMLIADSSTQVAPVLAASFDRSRPSPLMRPADSVQCFSRLGHVDVGNCYDVDSRNVHRLGKEHGPNLPARSPHAHGTSRASTTLHRRIEFIRRLSLEDVAAISGVVGRQQGCRLELVSTGETAPPDLAGWHPVSQMAPTRRNTAKKVYGEGGLYFDPLRIASTLGRHGQSP